MRTTLKRGIGRGASVNGNGRAILPPGALTPVTRYQQPPRKRGGLQLAAKIGVWLLAVVVMLAGSIAGGAYLFFHHSVAAIAPRSKDVIKASHELHVPLPNQPAIALVIGYDKRYHEAGSSRSDTVMLIRAQPSPKAISLLSFPRDLLVDIKCPGHDYGPDKINAAYSFCKAPGTLDTVRALTGLPINYLITVDFRGFTQVVDKLGGIWMDVDRRYFHSNAGTSVGSVERYAEINLFPGYQKLKGAQALGFVRYRHADNDVYRNARQQEFVKAVRQQVSGASYLKLPGVINAITRNLEVAKGGGGGPSESTVLSYALFAYGLPPGHVFQVKIDGLNLGPSYVTADAGAIPAAVKDFQNPDVQAADKAGSVVLHRHIGAKATVPSPSQTTVTVLNGNGIAGSATLAADGLHQVGYHILYPANGISADAPQRKFRTQVYFNPSKRHAKAAAQEVRNLFGSADILKLPRIVRPFSNGSMVVVVVGQTFHGTLASAPVDHTPPKEPAAVVRNVSATLGMLRKRRHKVGFPLEVPTLLERSSSPDPARPIRTYRINGGAKAVRLTFRMATGLDYWGIEETNWAAAPVLSDRNFKHRIKGREFDFYFNGPHLHMVVLRANGASYWVINTLLDSMSNQTMVAIAKGLKPLPRKTR
jgi:LCP family protein required for cell wall assembly